MVHLHITKAKAIAVGIPLILGQIVGGIQGEDSITWFKVLKKPFWTPPIPVFPLVWTALYALMGYASWIVWTYGGFEAQGSILFVYGVQLFLNLLWPILFFKQRKLKLAQFENIALLILASLTANSFYRVDRLAGKLLWPYIAWLVLANLLNISIAAKNPDAGASKFESNYQSQDKRNPGEQGNFPATASLQTPTTFSHRSRRNLIVYGKANAIRQRIRTPSLKSQNRSRVVFHSTRNFALA